MGSLAVYFFWRWQVSGEPFPSFRTTEDWYKIKVLKPDNLHLMESLSSQTLSTWTARLHKASGIHSSKITHAGRVSGARLAEENGVSEEQVMKNSYVTPQSDICTALALDANDPDFLLQWYSDY